MKKARAPRSVISLRATKILNGISRISRRSCGTSSKPLSPKARISAFIRYCTGRNSTCGNTSSGKKFPSSTCTSPIKKAAVTDPRLRALHGIDRVQSQERPRNHRRVEGHHFLRAVRPRAGSGRHLRHAEAPGKGVHVMGSNGHKDPQSGKTNEAGHRRPCRSRQVHPGGPPDGGYRQPAHRQTGFHQRYLRPAGQGVRVRVSPRCPGRGAGTGHHHRHVADLFQNRRSVRT